MYGFILMAKGNMIEFYSQNQETCNEWIEALKLSVVMLDLKDEFQLKQLLGQGNFAKVHLCHRKSDDKTMYALKTMEKSGIKKNKRNIVSRILNLDLRAP
jgi:calcium/calmodulin-dependent protein kinase I/calcium-dependent protein kinase